MQYKHRPDVVAFLNKPTDAAERARFLYYADSKFNLLKKPSTCTRHDFIQAGSCLSNRCSVDPELTDYHRGCEKAYMDVGVIVHGIMQA